MYSCDICSKCCSRPDSLKRHMQTHFHSSQLDLPSTSQNYMNPAPNEYRNPANNIITFQDSPSTSQNYMNSSQNEFRNPANNSIIFQHPFTMIATGPTQCGKTQFIRDLLLSDMIQPRPERIIYFYKRWQHFMMKCYKGGILNS